MKSGKDQAFLLSGTVVGRLLEAERVTTAAPTDLRARVMARARRALAQPVARPFRRPGSATRIRFAVAAGLLLAGAGALAGRHGGWGGPPREVPVATPVLAAAPPVATAAAGPAAPEPAPAARSAPRARSRGRDFRVEVELLDQAQEAVTARRFEAALAILEAHARTFPNGALVEEREALLVRTLSSLGRSSEARQAGAAFRKQFPRSVLGQRFGVIPAAQE
jgi:TolA-binding protein